MPPITISFRFEDNGRFHEDLVLRLGERQWRCDSYYLLLDDGIPPGQEDAAKVRAVLRRLIDQWRNAVAELADGEVCFLPFDFSDQYTGWLRCRLEGTVLRIEPGWAEVEGYSFLPSDVGEYLNALPGFRPKGEEVAVGWLEFLQAVSEESDIVRSPSMSSPPTRSSPCTMKSSNASACRAPAWRSYLLGVATLPALYIAAYLLLRLGGVYHPFYNQGGWDIDGSTGSHLLDAAFMPATVIECDIQNRLRWLREPTGG